MDHLAVYQTAVEPTTTSSIWIANRRGLETLEGLGSLCFRLVLRLEDDSGRRSIRTVTYNDRDADGELKDR